MKSKIRINKYLSDKKICSRRMADRLIEKGLVFVNGKRAQIGQKVSEKDKIVVKGADALKKSYKYYLFYKPVGYVSHKTSKEQKDARDLAGLDSSFAPVGRLDKASEGLMLFTNDGRIVDRLLNPKYEHEKEYIVWTDKYVKESDLKRLAKGVNIEGYITKPAKTRRLSDKSFRIILKEGKKHQIRRMLAALGYKTENLKRVRIMHMKLKNLKPGQKRKLSEKEKKELLSKLDLI